MGVKVRCGLVWVDVWLVVVYMDLKGLNRERLVGEGRELVELVDGGLLVD